MIILLIILYFLYLHFSANLCASCRPYIESEIAIIASLVDLRTKGSVVDVNVPSICSLDQVFSLVERHWNKDYKDKYEWSLSCEASPNDTEGKPNSFLNDFVTIFKANTSNTSNKARLETFASEFQQ